MGLDETAALDDIAAGINEMSTFFRSGIDLDNNLSDDEG